MTVTVPAGLPISKPCALWPTDGSASCTAACVTESATKNSPPGLHPNSTLLDTHQPWDVYGSGGWHCEGRPMGAPHGQTGWLWTGGVGVGAAEDVGVAKEATGRRRVRAVLVGRRRRNRRPVDQRLAVGVDGRTHSRVAAVHPHPHRGFPGGHHA